MYLSIDGRFLMGCVSTAENAAVFSERRCGSLSERRCGSGLADFR